MLAKSWIDAWRREGGGAELMKLALPLIVSNSIWTLQITIDRVMLSRFGTAEVAAAMPAVLLFWTPLVLLQNTAGYATTFVAQYMGARRPRSVGPILWQSLYISLVAGLAFFLLIPPAWAIFRVLPHDPHVRELEFTYFTCLCFSALPTLIVATTTSFFAGRGDSWTVLWINAAGLLTNAVLDYLWIFGAKVPGGLGLPELSFPAWGIAGAGWATVVGMWVSALVSIALLLRPRYRQEFALLSGWRLDPALLRRLLYFGVPNGLLWALDALAFTVFTFLVGMMGKVELAASSIAFTINIVAILPMLGMGQAVGILVGQRLGQERPDLAERSTWTGFKLAWLYMTLAAASFVLAPSLFLLPFQSDTDAHVWPQVALLVPVLLRFVAVYSLFDSMNLIFSFALRGAGDTRFVTLISLLMAWPLMVVPTALAWWLQAPVTVAWLFASAYIIALALVFLWRFRRGWWKSMRVIEPVVIDPDEQTSVQPALAMMTVKAGDEATEAMAP